MVLASLGKIPFSCGPMSLGCGPCNQDRIIIFLVEKKGGQGKAIAIFTKSHGSSKTLVVIPVPYSET